MRFRVFNIYPATGRNIVFTVILLVLGCFQSLCFGAEILFLDAIKSQSVEAQQVDLASRFYGLDIVKICVEERPNESELELALINEKIGGIVITGRALPRIDPQFFFKQISQGRKNGLPVLIMGLTPNTDKNSLMRWSDGVVTECKNLPKNRRFESYRVGDFENIALELAGNDIIFSKGILPREYRIVLSKTASAQRIIQIENSDKINKLPIFIFTSVNGLRIFFQAGICIGAESSQYKKWEYSCNRFFEIAPLLMFLRYAFGEKCWHSVDDYGNLTIDDPFLREPYGFLNFNGLLNEMKKHNFHTTIAFIPWNYNRNNDEIVTLFRENQDRYSLCVHGSDHDHREFGKYDVGACDATAGKALRRHEEKIKTAIARMEKMRILTELSYDRVMVFPHGIAPSPTLGLLKKYNFIATCNSSYIPLGSVMPSNSICSLKKITTHFENFPSLKRYPPIADKSTTKRSEISINLFLDNQILFYTHHGFFKDGIDAFNKTADVVNNIKPDLKWRNLGYIAQHSYLERLRDDGNYDIFAYTSNFILENRKQHTITNFIRKEESFCPPIRQIVVDGLRYPYDRSGNYLTLKLVIPPRKYRHVVIEYKNDLDLDSVNISKNDLHVALLRWLSDFRDLILSRNILGSWFISLYYKLGGKGLLTTFIGVAVFVFFVAFYFGRKKVKS